MADQVGKFEVISISDSMDNPLIPKRCYGSKQVPKSVSEDFVR